ncbi:FxsA family protein [Limibaculum sp. FT325]|uniref:FxsA family protein n=1 Tax=Thermohalobaculum sediminis TaxID=2939436 RepID=UPI0020C160D2|nr:FxsA family protein [Limibaculum sediminis]MCL5776642.1 FxsA family protein [Limibaculum sediminis]
MWLFAILLIVPLIEIGLFIEIGGLIGLWPTIAIVILTAAAGTLLLRRQGLRALVELQSRLSEGRDPGAVLAHGAMILIAGVLLLTPGFFTDAVGFLLLVPPIRAALIAAAARRMTVVHVHGRRGHAPRAHPGGRTVEGEYEDVTEAEPSPRADPGPPSGWTRRPGDDG